MEEEREVKPWDLINPDNYDKDQAEVDRRFAICQSCEFFTKRQTCAKCGCIMKLKTKLEKARCPIRKW
jgi:hypothetical protein